jgi:hypothetical protein
VTSEDAELVEIRDFPARFEALLAQDAASIAGTIRVYPEMLFWKRNASALGPSNAPLPSMAVAVCIPLPGIRKIHMTRRKE